MGKGILKEIKLYFKRDRKYHELKKQYNKLLKTLKIYEKYSQDFKIGDMVYVVNHETPMGKMKIVSFVEMQDDKVFIIVENKKGEQLLRTRANIYKIIE